MNTSWRVVGDCRVLVSCSGCHYGVTFLKPGPTSVFKHCREQRETIPQEVLTKLAERRNVLAQVAAAMADGV